MLSSRLAQATRSVSRHSLTFKKATVLRGYHVFHEEQANVLPNKVETASASFKVSELQKENKKKGESLLANEDGSSFRKTPKE